MSIVERIYGTGIFVSLVNMYLDIRENITVRVSGIQRLNARVISISNCPYFNVILQNAFNMRSGNDRKKYNPIDTLRICFVGMKN